MAPQPSVVQAGGQPLSAALALAGRLVGEGVAEPDPQKVEVLSKQLSAAIERDEHGRPPLKVVFPDDEALRALATTLAKLLG